MIGKSHAFDRQQAASSRRQQQRNRLNRLRAMTEETEHFHECPICRQQVDRRRLGDVLHHEQPDHQPIPRYEGTLRRFL